MMAVDKKRPERLKGELDVALERPLELAVIGLEAEFRLLVDDQAVRPEDVFGDPTGFIRAPLVHRQGTSYHLPTGGAIYFDTGVIEIATPVIEVSRGCAERAGRSLWESIRFVRQELDGWEKRSGRKARLAGFSAHYNISFDPGPGPQIRRIHDLARLLVRILPVPVMLLAANRQSTGIGVRPRGNRIEVTADFTPSASLMIATAALLTGIVQRTMKWSSFSTDRLAERGLPELVPFQPVPHTTRKGWLARIESFERNPFQSDVDEPCWHVRDSYFDVRELEPEPLSLRTIGRAIFEHFRRSIRRVADPFTYRLLVNVFNARTPVLLDLDRRPEAYDDVGRLCHWDDLFPEEMLSRSRYERVLIRAISGRRLRMGGILYRPVGMRGWTSVVFRREPQGTRHVFPIDFLVRHLKRWENDDQ